MPYWRLHYHLIWATKNRAALLDARSEDLLRYILNVKVRGLAVILHAFGCADDHAHVVASIPPKLAVAACLRHLKGASSRALNVSGSHPGSFAWQEEYGAISLSEHELPRVIDYVRRQREHHANGTTLGPFEQVGEADNWAL